MGILRLFVVVALVASTGQAFAGDWKPTGSVSVQYLSRNIQPVLSYVKYDKAEAVLDFWLNLPTGLAFQATGYQGLNGGGINSDKGDEIDIALWKKFALSEDGYLNLRVKYCNGFDMSRQLSQKPLAYDAFVGKKFRLGSHTLTPELRIEYWHYTRDLGTGMISVIPSLNHEYAITPKLTLYEWAGLQWNNRLAPFGELLSGQGKVGAKVKLPHNLLLNADLYGVTPLQSVSAKDPRKGGRVALEVAMIYSF